MERTIKTKGETRSLRAEDIINCVYRDQVTVQGDYLTVSGNRIEHTLVIYTNKPEELRLNSNFIGGNVIVIEAASEKGEKDG